eukprot:CAMPEP_0204045950 /NCGR_PEP_ID=MMETSP0360-20130528/109301_1 /ASSEMBLY_ACC=CAM_ASM_000342 /TAXON_ID=268821 /ORGANISM="Scrippsiella Hangoei, Strain SHTV-5" /LENGTH=137 /DNA_ID=CAMNT_0050992511 /DNA_START=109 /DNA_END=520 /DNA_ORIENTATION=+
MVCPSRPDVDKAAGVGRTITVDEFHHTLCGLLRSAQLGIRVAFLVRLGEDSLYHLRVQSVRQHIVFPALERKIRHQRIERCLRDPVRIPTSSLVRTHGPNSSANGDDFAGGLACLRLQMRVQSPGQNRRANHIGRQD